MHACVYSVHASHTVTRIDTKRESESLRSCTLDKSARFRIFSGGLRRPAAGAGSRVEITVPGAVGLRVVSVFADLVCVQGFWF